MFVAMMEQTWQSPEHENTKEVKAVVSLLTLQVKARILEKANNDASRLKKIF
jgi:hypothetical protein